MTLQLEGQGKGLGNREVSQFVGAADEKGAHGGNRVSPVGAERSEATAVEVER